MKTSAICASGNQRLPTIACHRMFNRLTSAMQSRQHFLSRRSMHVVAITHANVETAHGQSCGGTNRNGNRAQSQLQLLGNERVALAAHLEDFRLKRADLIHGVRGNRVEPIFAQPALSSLSDLYANRTRPIEVANAGNRAPTPSATLSRRRTATRAT